MAEELEWRRAEYGISYWSIESDAWETLGPVVAKLAGTMTITTAAGGRPSARTATLCGERVFTIDAPSIGPERHVPLLVLHGFPTSSFDYAAVLDGLRAGRRVLLLDMVGLRAVGQARPGLLHGAAGRRGRRLRGRPRDRRAWPCSPTTWATPSAASSWPGAPRGRGRSR